MARLWLLGCLTLAASIQEPSLVIPRVSRHDKVSSMQSLEISPSGISLSSWGGGGWHEENSPRQSHGTTAVCIRGQLRGLEQKQAENLKAFVIDPLGADPFVVTTPYPGYSVEETEQALACLGVSQQAGTLMLTTQDPTPAELKEEVRNAAPAKDFAAYEEYARRDGNALSPVFSYDKAGVIYEYVDNDKCIQLISSKETFFKYTYVVMARFDMRFLAPHPPLALTLANTVMVPDTGMDWEGVNDRHAMMHRAEADVYAGIWGGLKSGQVARIVSKGFNAERLLESWLKSHNVSISHIPMPAALVCCAAPFHNCWAVHCESGFKYEVEYGHALHTQKALKDAGGDYSKILSTGVLIERGESWPAYMRLCIQLAGVLLVCACVFGSGIHSVQKLRSSAYSWESVVAAISFLCLSSAMLVANKIMMVLLPLPATVIFTQFLFAAFSIRLASTAGFVDLGSVSFAELRDFLGVPITFCFTLYASANLLLHSNLETSIIIRCIAPLATAPLDVYFFNCTWPSRASCVALAMMFISACVYAAVDVSFNVRAYQWAFVWLGMYLFDKVYIKRVIRSVSMTDWGHAYYLNMISAIAAFGPALLEWYVQWQQQVVSVKPFPVATALCLLATCLIGTALSWCMPRVRELLAVTSASGLSTVSQILSVIINLVIWQRHENAIGIAMLFLCIAAASKMPG